MAFTLSCGLALSAAAKAQELPASGAKEAQVTDVSTELTSDQAVTAGQAEGERDATELSVAAGGVLSTGNARLLAATMASKLRYRRDANQLGAAAALNYGRAGKPGEGLKTTLENYQGVSRYDRFFGDFSLFLALQGRRDRFKGLDLRLRVDPGVGYYVLNQPELRLWLEGGYDFLYDIRRKNALTQQDAQGNLVLDGNGNPVKLERTRVVHSGRAFLGFEYVFHEALKLDIGLEFLQGLSVVEARQINGKAAVEAKIDNNLALSFSFTEYYDSQPLPGKEGLDTLTMGSLIYTLL